MKHKGRTTVRRENRRMDRKRERAAERQLLHTGGGQKVLRSSLRWQSSRVEIDLGEEEPSSGEPSSGEPSSGELSPPPRVKKKQPLGKKGGCPARGGSKRHHFLYETVTERDPYLPGYVYESRYKMCGYCGLYEPAWRRKPRSRRFRWRKTPGNC